MYIEQCVCVCVWLRMQNEVEAAAHSELMAIINLDLLWSAIRM